jgi:hypothetical protein
MKCCIVRKVPFRKVLAGKSRLVWGLILAEREGLTLIFLRKQSESQSHQVVIATENVTEKYYEAVNVSAFPLEHSDLSEVGLKLNSLGCDMAEDEFLKMLEDEEF